MKIKGKDLRVELGYLRDNLIEGINQGKTALVKDSLEMYGELVRAFIDKLKEYGSPYDKKRAMRELSALKQGWSEIEWIRDDLREIIDASIGTCNIHVIRHVLYFPVHLASLAFVEEDYYIFHQFINWVPYYYGASLRIQDLKVQEFIVDRCWRWLKETVEFIIVSDIERRLTEEDIERRNDFAVGVVLVFNQLLKRSYDEKQLDHFKGFVGGLSSLFEDYERRVMEHGVEEIERRLERQQLTEAERSGLERELSLRKKHTWVVTELKQRKALVLYGVNAWILHHYDTGRLKTDEFKSWHENVPPFGDITETWELYLKASEHEVEHEFGWDWWELEEHPEGRAAYMGFERCLQLLCCIRCLEVLKGISPNVRGQIAVPHSPDILYLAEREDSPLVQILNRIAQQTEKWTPVVGDEGITAIPAFREMLERAVGVQKKEDIRVLIAAQLWDERIEEVKQNVLKEWRLNAELRHIVQKHGHYEYVPTPPDAKGFIGFNMIDRKDVYVKESTISAHGWGENYGRGLADAENEIILGKIVPRLPPLIAKRGSDQEIVKAVEEALGKLDAAGYSPIVLILKSWSASRVLETSDAFSAPQKEEGKPRLVGYYKGKLVFRLHYRGGPTVVVVDIGKLGIWRQFKPKQLLEGEQYISEELSFCIRPFTRESALELIRKQPKFRRDKDGTERPEEDVLTELQQRVHIRIVEQFEFEVVDRNAGWRISVANEI